ncbi:hypothetical protein J5751_04835 [bacterium]|nr:hypothetical protein [bacterium]
MKELTQKDIKQLKERYKNLYSIKSVNFSIWDEIARYCRIEKRFVEDRRHETAGYQLDSGLADPSTLLAINSSANNLYGILIGDGDFFNLTISEELKEVAGIDEDAIDEYLKRVAKKVLREINKPEANFKQAILEHLKDQQTFGTSGIGTFVSNDYLANRSNSIFEFLPFGVDNITIDEGRNGRIDTIFVDYNWRINKIIKSFCCEDGVLNKEKFDKLPDKVKSSYKDKPNDRYDIQLAIVQNDFFQQGVEGKIGCRYIGIWYLKDESDYILDIEYYQDNPINVVRVDKVRGELYGRADGTKILSFIKMLNYCMADAVEVVDKMVHPALAIVDGSLTGDKIIDTSPNSATIVKLPANSNQLPIFNLQDLGDPSGLLQILLPYLRETISTAFKVDILLDNNDQQAKTATEMIQRYNIRSKLLYSMVYQQVNGLLIPLINYCIKVMFNLGLLGVEEGTGAEDELVIPDIVLDFIRKGKDWFKIEFKTEISKMAKSQELEDIAQLLQLIGGMAQFNPEILNSIDWYDMISRCEYLLSNGESYLISKNEYKKIISSMQEAQAQANNLQGQLANSEMNKNNAIANKDMQEAINKSMGY